MFTLRALYNRHLTFIYFQIAEHHCHLKFSSYPCCCWRCDSYCPNSEDEGCGPHLEVINRDKVITIYKDKLNMMDFINSL